MNMHLFSILYVCSFPVFCFFDLLWVGVIARPFYNTQIGHLMGEVRWGAAIAFYAIFLFGLTFFATYPAVTAGKFKTAIFLGGMFGLMTYMTYDLTNLATLKGWTIKMTVIDMIWGTCLGALTAFIVSFVYIKIIR